MTTVKTEAAFTPGRWGYEPDEGSWLITYDLHLEHGPRIFAEVFGPAGQANARLIAAAPDLYEALVEAERCIEDAQQEFDCKWSGLHQVRAALAKARGDAPSSKDLMDG